MKLLFSALFALLAVAAGASAQTTRTPGLEPGVAEARDRQAVEPLPTTWQSPAVEARGVWMAADAMLQPKEEILRQLDLVKEAGLNTVLIDTFFRGFVAYPGGEIIPQYPQFEGQDIMAFLIEECHKRGLRASMWMEYGFYAYFTPDAANDPSMGPILDKHPELLSINFNGEKYIHRAFGDFYSICPSNPKSHQILADMMAEAVTKYPEVDGLNLDRIRYAGGDYCYCDYCREHFEKETGIELRQFDEGSQEAQKWLEWKRQQTAEAVATIVKTVRNARSDIAITAYVVGPDEMEDKAQGWDLWMQQDLLDGIAVSMYGADIRPATEKAIKMLGGSDKLISAINAGQETPVFLTNIAISRRYDTLGQFVWHLGDMGDDIEGLKSGPYQEPAESPFAK